MKITMVLAIASIVPTAVTAQTTPKIEIAAVYAPIETGALGLANLDGPRLAGTDYVTKPVPAFRSGWLISAAPVMNRFFAIAVEVSSASTTFNPAPEFGEFSQDLYIDLFSVAAGPKFTERYEHAVIFAQVLLGRERLKATLENGRSGSDWQMAFQPGAGVDIRIARNLAMRAGLNVRVVRAESRSTLEGQYTIGMVVSR